MALILDRDIVIDHLRERLPAVEYVESCWAQASLSAITVGELYQNVRGDAKARKIELMTSALNILPMTLEIAKLGGLFCKQYKGRTVAACWTALSPPPPSGTEPP